MRTVAIVGVGLIGASFGLALRKTGFNGPILGVSSPAAIEAGLACGAVSASAALQDAAAQADFIYLSQPVDRIVQTLKDLGSLAQNQAFITDAGSTKAVIVGAAADLPNLRFVGGHPLAGKESRGARSADADLFRGRPYVLTPDQHPVPDWFRDLLARMGATVVEMTPEDHDAVVALTSHLPQLISTALAAFLSYKDQSSLQSVYGSGLLDMTRLALSPADLWSSILATNKANVAAALSSYAEVLLRLKSDLERDCLEPTFDAAEQFSHSLRKLHH